MLTLRPLRWRAGRQLVTAEVGAEVHDQSDRPQYDRSTAGRRAGHRQSSGASENAGGEDADTVGPHAGAPGPAGRVGTLLDVYL